MCTPSMPGQGNAFWTTGAPGMTADEAGALPGLDPGTIAWGGIEGIAARRNERADAIEKWKAANPERYQQGLRDAEANGQNPAAAPGQQAARAAQPGAGGGGGGGGSSSQNTLLTSGATDGVNPNALDLSKTTLLGL